jgi:hypothetical protein
MGIAVMRFSRAFWALAAAAFLLAGPAQAAKWQDDGRLPACEHGLNSIVWEFAQKEDRFWNTGARILSFERVREIAYSPWAPGTIPRRFCTAVALVNDGRKHTVNFWIGEGTGLIGASWGVRWCVVGFDHNWAYNPNCKMARP